MIHCHVVYVMAVDIMSLTCLLGDVRFEVKVVLFCGENVHVTVS